MKLEAAELEGVRRHPGGREAQAVPAASFRHRSPVHAQLPPASGSPGATGGRDAADEELPLVGRPRCKLRYGVAPHQAQHPSRTGRQPVTGAELVPDGAPVCKGERGQVERGQVGRQIEAARVAPSL